MQFHGCSRLLLLSLPLSERATWLFEFRKRGEPRFCGIASDEHPAADFHRAQSTGLAKLSAHLGHVGGHFFFRLIDWSTGFVSAVSSFFAFRRALRS